MEISVWSFLGYTLLGAVAYFLWSVRARTLPGVVVGPGWVPFFGHYFELKKNRLRTWDWISEIANGEMRGKTWQMSVPNSPIILQAAPSEAVTRLLLKDHFDNYLVSKRRQDWTEELFGNGIFATNGKVWHAQRKAASSIFTLRLLRDGMAPVFIEHAQTVVKLLKAAAAKGEAVDMQDLFFRYTMDSFCQIAFGEEVGCLSQANPHPFPKAFDTLQAAIMTRVFDLLWKVKRRFNWSGPEQTIREQVAIVNQYAKVFIAHRRDDLANGKVRHDLISHFMAYAKKTENRDMTDNELRDVIINFLVAGRDTTACALSWLFFELNQNPEALKKVVAEVDSLMPDRDTVPTFEIARDMTYTEAALLESLRLHPSVPAEGRIATKGDTLPDGIEFPAGTGVNYNPYVYGRSPELWGEDVLQYKPERWLAAGAGAADATTAAGDIKAGAGGDAAAAGASESKTENTLDFNESTHLKVHNQFKFPSFNCGLRLCMGRGLALLEAKIMIASILSQMRCELAAGQNITYLMTVTLMIKGGIKMKPVLRTA